MEVKKGFLIALKSTTNLKTNTEHYMGGVFYKQAGKHP